jgi:hypothetical protein
MANSLITVNNLAYQLARSGGTSFPLRELTYQNPAIDSTVEQTFTVTALTGVVGPPATTTNSSLQFTSINTDVPISITINNPARATIYRKVSNSALSSSDCPNSSNIGANPNGWVAVASGSQFPIAPNQYLGVALHAIIAGSQTITLRSHVDTTPVLITLSPATWTHTST